MKISIDLDEVKQLAQDGKQIFLRPEGEAALLRLLELQEQVAEAVEEAKRLLAAEAEKINPHFSSLRADHLTVYYRAYGPKYRLDEDLIRLVPRHLYVKRPTYSVIAAEVEKLLSDGGELPAGIVEAHRLKQITFSRKGVEDGEA